MTLFLMTGIHFILLMSSLQFKAINRQFWKIDCTIKFEIERYKVLYYFVLLLML